MQAVIFCGIQGTGKSTFFRDRFFYTHVRLSLDMLRTRHREGILLRACVEGKQPFVIDNTNPTRAERARYIAPAKAAGFAVTGYYFESKVDDALRRNAGRPEPHRVPKPGLFGTYKRLEIPRLDEGFHALHYVRIDPDRRDAFLVEDWRDDV